ncbi:Uncharacterised protein [Mycobacteroides abscessus subsp. abscessus]|nr:Uncharacterised protein [Mycobacteroides abscessus subsp. abscessus]
MRSPNEVVAATLRDYGIPDASTLADVVLADLQAECFVVVDPLKIGNAIVDAAQRDSEER